MPPSAPPCVVCGNAQAKYRCPKCLARYCSVDCCRRHKEGATDGDGGADGSGCRAPSSAVQAGTTAQTDPAEAKPSRYGMELEKARRLLGLPLVSPLAGSSSSERRDDGNYDELEEGWKLTDQMVSAMGKCDWLKRELQDESLRQLVALVTAASNAVVKATFSKSRRLQGHDDETEQDNVLDRLKSELPHFRRFLDKLLVVAGVLERPPRRGTGG